MFTPIALGPPEAVLADAGPAPFLETHASILPNIIDSMGDGLIVADLSGHLLFFNPTAERLLGRGVTDAPLPDWSTSYGVFRPDGLEMFPPTELPLARAIRGEESNQVEILIRNVNVPEGRFISVTGRPLRDQAGKLCGGVCVFRDITDRKAALERVRRSEERYRNLFNASPDAILVKDYNGIVLDVNPAACVLYRREPEELIDRNILTLVPAARREEAAHSFRRLVRGEDQFCDLFLLSGDGQSIPVEVRLSHVHHNETAALLLHVRDVSERRRNEQLLRESQERFALAVQGSRDGIWDWDIKENRVYFSPRWKEMLGYSDNELQGHFSDWSDRLHPDDRAHSLRNLQLYIQGDSNLYEVEHRMRHKDGSYRWILARGHALRDAYGRPYRMAGSHTDITARKIAEQESEQARLAAERANQSKNEFLANVSHELRTPLGGILGLTELVLETNLSDLQRDYLSMVRSSSHILLEVINDLLDFSKIEAGKLEVDPQPFALRHSLAQIVRMLGVRAYSKGLDLAYYVAEDVPDHLVGDWGRIRQILLNVIGNAIKFTEQGSVAVCVEREAAPSPGEKEGTPATANLTWMTFAVTDTGMGIPLARQRSIFEPFVQMDGSMSRKHGGTGLGLTISRHLAELMGGQIELTSTEGQGSTFRLRIGMASAARPALEENPPALSRQPELEGLPIFVVEENTWQREFLVRILSGWGACPVVVSNLDQVFQHLEEHPSATQPVVLLDTRISRGECLYHFSAPHLLLLCPPAERNRVGKFWPHLTRPIIAEELLAMLRQLRGLLAPVSPGEESQSSVPPPVRSLRVLVAEDNHINQVLIVNLLTRHGHQVTLVGNGKEAVQAFHAQRFDVVLMDVQMPELDGLRATQLIRQAEASMGGHVPIIALTAHAMQISQERCRKAGMDAHLAKPIDSRLLFHTLAELTDRCQEPSAPPPLPLPLPPAALGDDTAVLDRAAALERVGGDTHLLGELTRMFLAELPSWIEQLRLAHSAEDSKQVRRLAHTIKGAVSTLGGRAAQQAAGKLEEQARAGNLVDSGVALNDLELRLMHLGRILNPPPSAENCS